jgi:hypothetical protein
VLVLFFVILSVSVGEIVTVATAVAVGLVTQPALDVSITEIVSVETTLVVVKTDAVPVGTETPFTDH